MLLLLDILLGRAMIAVSVILMAALVFHDICARFVDGHVANGLGLILKRILFRFLHALIFFFNHFLLSFNYIRDSNGF